MIWIHLTYTKVASVLALSPIPPRQYLSFFLVPLQINISEISARSVVLRWSQPGGRQDGLSGFLVQAYERSEDGRRAHGGPISNCTTTVVDRVDDGNTCRLENLQPSTNYSITVTTFKRHSEDKIIFGDESEAIDFTTGRSGPTVESLSELKVDRLCHPFH